MRNWLKEIRKKAGITQAELGELVDLDITTINKYELNERTPTVANAKKIGELLNFDWQKFYE